MRIGKALLASALGMAGLIWTSSARADLEIALQETGVNGGLITVVATGPSFSAASFSGTYGAFSVSIFGGSSDNGASLSDLLSSTTSVTNTSGSTATLHLYATQTDYTLPTGAALNVESGLGGSVSSGTLTDTGIFKAYADKNNNLFGTTDFTNGLQNATASGSTFQTGSAYGTFSRSGNFSLTSVANFQLTAGGKANYSDHVNVTAVPLPASATTGLSLFAALGALVGLRKLASRGVAV